MYSNKMHMGRRHFQSRQLIQQNLSFSKYIKIGYKGAPPTLQNLHSQLLKQKEQLAQEIALALELFTQGSLNTFAQQTNVDTQNRSICYDILDLGK